MGHDNGNNSMYGEFKVVEERSFTESESLLFNNPFLDNAACYAKHPTPKTNLTLAKVYHKGHLVGIAPLTRLIKYRGTRLLSPKWRKWMDPVFGAFTQETTCMIDTTFMAFSYDDPFLSTGPQHARAVRESIVAHLQGCRDVDNIFISEPAGDPNWAQSKGFKTFLQLPIVHVKLNGCRNLDNYLKKLSQKRRRNFRNEQKLFKKKGGSMQVVKPPHSQELLDELHSLLLSSSDQNRDFKIPYEDLYNSRQVLEIQRLWIIVARHGDKIIGFFAFIPNGQIINQCHGGLDYHYSLQLKAYPNLMHEATIFAIDNGFHQLSLGPLNNEAKRRVGALAPVMSALWVRNRMSRWFIKKVMLQRFQIYGGPVEFPYNG